MSIATATTVSSKQFFSTFRAFTKDWIRLHGQLPATCFVDARCPKEMNKGHRTEKVRVGEYKSNSGDHKKGDPKYAPAPNPFLDFVNTFEDGSPKPKVQHAIRTHADLRFNYTQLVQDAQSRAGNERDFKAGEPQWEWRAFKFEDIALPLVWKVWRDPVTKAEIDMPDKDKSVYIYLNPKRYARDKDGNVRFSAPDEPIKLSGNKDWYEEINGTGPNGEQHRIDYKLLEPYIAPPQDAQKEADRQGHGNPWEVVRPLIFKLVNLRYLVVNGRRWYMKKRDMGPIFPVDIEQLEYESEAASDEEQLPASELIGYEMRSKKFLV